VSLQWRASRRGCPYPPPSAEYEGAALGQRPRIAKEGIEVLIAGDSPSARWELARRLGTEGILASGWAGEDEDILAALQGHDWDLLLLDLAMIGQRGLDLVRRVKVARPATRILVRSRHSERRYAERALRAGASGYLDTGCGDGELIAAIRRVAGGGLHIGLDTAERMARQRMPDAVLAPHNGLSERQYQVFMSMIDGWDTARIAEGFLIGIKTVQSYKRGILKKLGLPNEALLSAYAAEHGLER
jgi:DNA-binding NarL/FixJ family response regulator